MSKDVGMKPIGKVRGVERRGKMGRDAGGSYNAKRRDVKDRARGQGVGTRMETMMREWLLHRERQGTSKQTMRERRDR